MLTSFSVGCPYEDCAWTGSLMPSVLQGGSDAEIVSGDQAWFQCPRCKRDWEVRITNDKVVVVSITAAGGDERREHTQPQA